MVIPDQWNAQYLFEPSGPSHPKSFPWGLKADRSKPQVIDLPDYFISQVVAVLVNVTLEHQVAVGVVGGHVVGDDSAGNTEGSGNWRESAGNTIYTVIGELVMSCLEVRQRYSQTSGGGGQDDKTSNCYPALYVHPDS